MSKLIVFFGTEAARRRFVKDRQLDPRRVLLAVSLANRGGLHGFAEPVDTWIADHDGLRPESREELWRQIDLLNHLHGKKPA